MPVITTQLQVGFPGDVSRYRNANVVPNIYDTTVTTPFAAYGLVAAITANGGVGPATTGTRALGILVRPFPTSSSSIPGAINNAVPPTTNSAGVPLQADILESGFITVNCYAGTPGRGNYAYVRVGGATANNPLGGIEAVADATPANTVLLDGTGGTPKVYFNNSGTTASAGNPVPVEIGFNI